MEDTVGTSEPGFQVLGINHIGLAPKDARALSNLLGSTLGLNHLGDEEVGAQKTLTSMFRSISGDSGASESGKDDSGLGASAEPRLEVLEPVSGQGPIAKFLDKKGSGIHHLALTVNDVRAAMRALSKRGVTLLSEEPQQGAHNTQIVFLHPKSTGGILVELVEEA